MKPHDEMRPSEGRRIQLRSVSAAVFAMAALAACTGENLFTGPSLGGGALGPTVDITAPAAGATFATGDSVQVTATVTSANGVTQVTLSGSFATGASAFVTQVVSLPNSPDTTLSRFLKRAGTNTGSARIIVQATDLLGGSGADTVAVTIGS